ncbi:hypothetical protein SKAU_G00056780 [Synaphobranchus kaupii]|uniref:Uncharacterized protein n=1 Tax=Synaphobranchus kaupii TaxID=118154 RepID=A0A9Q1G409_SYNKA|nr:hypothetical protein SKAU_G00056780 [Synaphobranchus kaupii]
MLQFSCTVPLVVPEYEPESPCASRSAWGEVDGPPPGEHQSSPTGTSPDVALQAFLPFHPHPWSPPKSLLSAYRASVIEAFQKPALRRPRVTTASNDQTSSKKQV